ncbi:RNA ligase family protein [Paenibacillus beijingensis]|uniref:DNA ligase (ATP) n=1 Tax=Paenibacillus beijingensis TaxID=1126833 RepID=A0A0D5NFB1_9BACL|nr:RNA ligase family protein [Paenibacillus beijingensis]AJY73941.1 DNA ligase [Paenibacillus beijingensis]
MKLTPIFPFEPISTSSFPIGEQWTAQIKWDGVRILSYYDGTESRLFNRKQNERTLQYPELTNPKLYCKADSFILDGEVIALENGKPSFHQVMKRDSLKHLSRIQEAKQRIPIAYMVFDILYCNGSWVIDEPLSKRQSLLEQVLMPGDVVQTVPSYRTIPELFQTAQQHQLEGIVIKDLTSSYPLNGKDKRWQKRKIVQDLIAVVGGVTHRDGVVNALLLGLYDENRRLWYIGHAGTGKVKVSDWNTLTEIARHLKRDAMPFVNRPDRSRDATWIEPQLTVKIQFLEWTKYRTLRQPSIQAFVDTPPLECTWPAGNDV